ncbi:Hypothetical predicted protein, partial [Olea europaea subsp. europaea]
LTSSSSRSESHLHRAYLALQIFDVRCRLPRRSRNNAISLLLCTSSAATRRCASLLAAPPSIARTPQPSTTAAPSFCVPMLPQ